MGYYEDAVKARRGCRLGMLFYFFFTPNLDSLVYLITYVYSHVLPWTWVSSLCDVLGGEYYEVREALLGGQLSEFLQSFGEEGGGEGENTLTYRVG